MSGAYTLAVPLPAPSFIATQGVLQLPKALPVDPGRDEVFISAVKAEFPNVVNRAILPPDAPPIAPHLVLTSTSSQLAVSRSQVDFQVQFYGDFRTDFEQALEYVERKLRAALDGFAAIDAPPTMLGIVASFNFSFKDVEGDGPAAHVLRTHLRTEVDPGVVQDALARVALRVRDTYFVTLTTSNYETRTWERPILPGTSFVQIPTWEGQVDDVGVQLIVDINNNLEGRVAGHAPTVTADAISAISGMLRQIAHEAGPKFAETGALSPDDVVASSTL